MSGIYLVYTCHMKKLSYDRYIPGIYHISYTYHIPGIYVSLAYESPFYTGYIPGIYLSHEIVRSARLQNLDCNAAAHRYLIARVFNVLQNVAAVPLGIRQPA